MITVEHVTATVTSAALGSLVVLGGPGWTHYAVTAWRTVLTHYRVLVAWAKHRRSEKQEFRDSALGKTAERPGWEDDPDSLRDLPVVWVPDQDVAATDPDQTAAEPVQSGRHSKEAAA